MARSTLTYKNMLQMGDKPCGVTGNTAGVKRGLASRDRGSSSFDSGSDKEENTKTLQIGDGRRRPTDMNTPGDHPPGSNEAATQKRDGRSRAASLTNQNDILSEQHVEDISQFNREVYEALTSREQSYSINHKIAPGESCTWILRQIRGGGLEKVSKQFEHCRLSLEIDRTNIRVAQQEVKETSKGPSKRRQAKLS